MRHADMLNHKPILSRILISHCDNLQFTLSVCQFGFVISEVALLAFCRSVKRDSDRDAGSIVWLNAAIYICVGIAVSLGFIGVGYVRAWIWVRWVGLWFAMAIRRLAAWAAVVSCEHPMRYAAHIRATGFSLPSVTYRRTGKCISPESR